jgi:hypothetical protein
VVTQAHTRGNGIGKRQAAAGLLRHRRLVAALTPTAVRARVWGRKLRRRVAQRGDQQDGRANESQQVDTGDHQYQLTLS